MSWNFELPKPSLLGGNRVRPHTKNIILLLSSFVIFSNISQNSLMCLLFHVIFLLLLSKPASVVFDFKSFKSIATLPQTWSLRSVHLKSVSSWYGTTVASPLNIALHCSLNSLVRTSCKALRYLWRFFHLIGIDFPPGTSSTIVPSARQAVNVSDFKLSLNSSPLIFFDAFVSLVNTFPTHASISTTSWSVTFSAVRGFHTIEEKFKAMY
mmetsp:Transcript_6579/g.16004  ORF Transcript_6579/g.16004 Transcript_6579/m.16004 type:complete len:210 (-) Transcript_6579:3624-4253(-)